MKFFVIFGGYDKGFYGNHSFNKQQHNDTTYYEVYSILKKELNFSWRKASQHPPR